METNRKISNIQQNIYAEYEKEATIGYFEIYKTFINTFENKNLEIVDIGGGSGYFANEVKTFYESKNNNVSMTVIDYCKYDEWEKYGNINFINLPVFEALEKIENECLDIIFINAVLHHLVYSTYKKTRNAQKQLMGLAYTKLKKNGYVCIRECYVENPVIKELSIPLVYWLTSSKNPLILRMSKKLGSNSAGVGVCFLSIKKLVRLFGQTGFEIMLGAPNMPWEWDKKYLIRHNKSVFVLKK